MLDQISCKERPVGGEPLQSLHYAGGIIQGTEGIDAQGQFARGEPPPDVVDKTGAEGQTTVSGADPKGISGEKEGGAKRGRVGHGAGGYENGFPKDSPFSVPVFRNVFRKFTDRKFGNQERFPTFASVYPDNEYDSERTYPPRAPLPSLLCR